MPPRLCSAWFRGQLRGDWGETRDGPYPGTRRGAPHTGVKGCPMRQPDHHEWQVMALLDGCRAKQCLIRQPDHRLPESDASRRVSRETMRLQISIPADARRDPAYLKRGRFAGMPARRGHRSAHASRWQITANDGGPTTSSSGSNPRRASSAAGQRSEPPSPGGSLTISTPPGCSRGAAHSATTAGGPKLRATTRS